MAYDPTKPATNAPIVSAELRTQFAGLKTLIDARAAPLLEERGMASRFTGLAIRALQRAEARAPNANQGQPFICLPSAAFSVCFILPERRVCGCSHEAEKNR